MGDSVQIKNHDIVTQVQTACQSQKHHILPFQSARPLQTQQKPVDVQNYTIQCNTKIANCEFHAQYCIK